MSHASARMPFMVALSCRVTGLPCRWGAMSVTRARTSPLQMLLAVGLGAAALTPALLAGGTGPAQAAGVVTVQEQGSAPAGSARAQVTVLAPALGGTGGGTPEPDPPPPRELDVAFSGDVLVHGPVRETAVADGGGSFDFAPMLTGVAPFVREADLALCHLEVPLGREGDRFTSYPVFLAPPQVASGLAATGYDGCSTASNHSLDRGPTGVASTLDALDAAGLGHTGTARDAAEAARLRTYDVETAGGPVTVAHLSYSYGFNGFPVPADAPWAANAIDAGRIAQEAAAADAAADIVIVSLHWGQEYQVEPTPEQVALAEAVTATGAVDCVVGHHAHVVQPIDVVNGVPVLYGLGNEVAGPSHDFAGGRTREGLAARITFEEAGDDGFTVAAVGLQPLYTAHPPLRVLAPTAASQGREAQAYSRTLETARSFLGDSALLVPAS